MHPLINHISPPDANVVMLPLYIFTVKRTVVIANAESTNLSEIELAPQARLGVYTNCCGQETLELGGKMYVDRINRVKKAMASYGVDALLVSSRASIFYLTGMSIGTGERLLALFITPDNAPRLFVNELFLAHTNDNAELVAHKDSDDALEPLAASLSPYKSIGVDKDWPSHFLLSLMERTNNIQFKNGSRCVDEVRMIKSADELVLMREASRMNDECMRAVRDALRAGATEYELAKITVKSAIEQGSEGASFGAIVAAGKGAAEPHHETSNVRVQNNEGVIVDIGCLCEGYCSDMTRTLHLGEATDKFAKVHNTVHRAALAAQKCVKPGVPLSEIDRAARDVITQEGWGEEFTHRTGHGIGIEVHEKPDVSASSSVLAKPGMCFSIEPGIYLPGEFGVRIEDIVCVTKDGVEVLNSFERELVITPV